MQKLMLLLVGKYHYNEKSLAGLSQFTCHTTVCLLASSFVLLHAHDFY